MTIATDEIMSVYLETGDYHETAKRLGLKYDAVRKRVRRALPPGSSTLVQIGDEAASIRLQWLRRPWSKMTAEELLELAREAFAGFTGPTRFPKPPRHTEDDLATVYPLADWHVGLLSWAKETGCDWDLSIGRQKLTEGMAELIARSPRSTHAVLLGLGDMLHSDNFDGTTARSKNVLDVDGRYPKILHEAIQILIAIVYMALRHHDTVHVRLLRGNHDEQSSIAVAIGLQCYFAKEPRVTVDADPSHYWYWTWGSVLVGATHGDKAKPAAMPNIMADEVPELWGKSKYRYVYTGHIHKQTCIEERGCTVESFQSPVAQDAWHRGMGYRGNRSMTSITMHKDGGEIKRDRINLK